MKRKIILMGLLSIFVVGCSLSKSPRRYSRFLGDYTEFIRFDQNSLVYRHPYKRIVDYEKFYFEQIKVIERPVTAIRGPSKEELEKLEMKLRKNAIEVFSERYQVVDQLGPGVILVKTAIIDLRPRTWVSQGDGTNVMEMDHSIKGSRFELDCRDSKDNERIFAMSALYEEAHFTQGEERTSLDNVEEIFKDWTRKLKKLLDRAKAS